jgi:hypothetical protein
MPKFKVSVYRMQNFTHVIDAEDYEDAALQMTPDSDLIEELIHDHPDDVSNSYWSLDYIDKV